MSPMTFPQQVITIALCVLGTVATRFLPFLISVAASQPEMGRTLLELGLPVPG